MHINNIFTSLARDKSPGVIQEFVLWVITCVMIVLSMVAAIIGHGNVTWIMIMLFAIGLAVLLAFRLKAIAMLYGVCSIHFIVTLIHFLVFNVNSYDSYYSNSVLNIILFILVVLLAVGLIVCQFIQAFARVDLGNILPILAIADTAGIVLLQILIFALPVLGDTELEYWHEFLNTRAYWFGTVSLWTMLVIITLLYVFSFWGPMNSNRGKVLSSTTRMPGLYGVMGTCQGRTIRFSAGLFVIGSGTGVSLQIPDQYVSSRHCSIRYNPSTGKYEIRDESTNGTFITDGRRFTKGQYQSVERGSVICIGSMAQQLKLL